MKVNTWQQLLEKVDKHCQPGVAEEMHHCSEIDVLLVVERKMVKGSDHKENNLAGSG